LEEADETMFWLELLGDSQTVPSVRLQPLLTEAEELVRIFSAARNTTRHRP
jgi:hypothetical protein